MDDNFLRLEKYLADKKEVIDKHLDKYIQVKGPSKIWESMKYSVMAGGKRLRPVLSLTTAELLDFPIENVLPIACAIEMIHTQSLIHDDLPGMDNDNLRRGKPTNHVIFGEAMAIIAGDALFAQAFNLIIRETPKSVKPENILKAIYDLSIAAGAEGMCGGQAMDITIEKSNEEIDSAIVQYIHTHKTGAMLRTSVRSAAIMADANPEKIKALTSYAENIGLAFQIVDDVLDVVGLTEDLGKTIGKDQKSNKATYPRLYGITESMNMAENHVNRGINDLLIFGDKAEYLILLAEYILKRKS
ncbi:MAG: polyprenyl synthetase family protein [Candidatus Sericytochromatia bacterium]|nr:polyprenyl synthetase family protein [Candidatus Sericytochromatia bacterium]